MRVARPPRRLVACATETGFCTGETRHARADAVIGEANHGMLLAKRAGRDRISIAPASQAQADAG